MLNLTSGMNAFNTYEGGSADGNGLQYVTDSPFYYDNGMPKGRGTIGEALVNSFDRSGWRPSKEEILNGASNPEIGDSTPVSGSDTYGSNDITGYDQTSWALEQQWKLDEAEREFNSAEAQKQRDWEKMMSDTAISRAVADIKAAGLNPWLALNGGSLGAASTPSGASASSSSGSSKVPQNYFYKLLAAVITSAGSLLGKFLAA